MSGVTNNDQFDPEVLDSLHEAIGDSINRIISIYVDDFPQSIHSMRLALQQSDFATIGRLAHSLKSSSGNLGALQLVTLSLNLEKMIKDNVTAADQIQASIDQLEQAFLQVRPRLLGYIR